MRPAASVTRTRVVIGIAAAGALAATVIALTRPSPESPSPESPSPSPSPENPITSPSPSPESPITSPSPSPTLADPAEKELLVEGKPYRFLERRYTPELLLQPTAAPTSAADEASPEAAVRALYSAFVRGDWDAALATMDEASRAWQLAQDTPRERFLEAWRREYGGHRFYLTRRIDIPGYAILYMRREDRAVDAPLSRVPLAFAVDRQGRWRFTQALRDHPVYGYDGLRDPHEVRVVGP